jgi:hypothetical protein
MNDELDCELTSHQWDALKSLRNAASQPTRMNRFILDRLIALGLAAMNGNVPVITSNGRKVLIRGSSRLLDLAA